MTIPHTANRYEKLKAENIVNFCSLMSAPDLTAVTGEERKVFPETAPFPIALFIIISTDRYRLWDLWKQGHCKPIFAFIL